MKTAQTTFAPRLIQWQKQHGRHHLAWQVSDPYAIWLSEIMLQQTQVSTVSQYFPRFVARFPDIATLANANEDEVLSLWAGLGYYSRARNLHKAAQQIQEKWQGKLPQSRQELETLAGVGRSTAAAICAFAFLQRETILDGNVKRILCRIFAQDSNPQDKKFEQSLWNLAEQLLPTQAQDMPSYTQGLMDLGATICKRSNPLCERCPMSDICLAKQHNRIHELPRKKSPIKVSEVHLYWLIINDSNDKILIHKRPSTGIWASLFCVPTFENLPNALDFIAPLHLDFNDFSEQPTFSHKLTHRLLHITPLHAKISVEPTLPSPYFWVSPQNLTDYGMPKPLSHYLQNHLHATK